MGSNRGLEANNGEIKTKLSFRQNQQATIPGTPIIAKPLAEGVLGEANMDGTIYVSDKLDPNSFVVNFISICFVVIENTSF